MFNKLTMSAVALGFALLSGCASVPMESADKDQALKSFSAPPQDQAGLYIFRDSSLGAAVKKTIKIDDEVIGETAAKTYFYRLVSPGPHVLATESEFGDNLLELNAQAGKNHYVRQSIKMGVFVGGAKLTEVSESEGQQGVRNTKLAR
ncbi:DUF2846 domain-containing protein [Stutzerimonas stutzeri]|uniref:DUF2846 domain-containing protein n=1 Tax=Stutzerimonas stutzeri subgroup TaxID=578833 RepID=UPI0002548D6A|nr:MULTISPECIES: DUF2846 domain-containing protein [Stutzerimonas stutzeri subgroup]KJS22089.1 MAG: hypothetical protein VR76_15980 [Pseudomonas sp. BRH_c35]KRW65545.1 hypothetical protein AO741_14565 [Pseudomonas sp. TTU2014-105ASC]EHY76849.1 hypothetical protein PstZobell_05348 [Stutzerimonas stutzeri ATCC 14405 = CCUG 16156]QOZ95403.1 DUF2846 domain-containing protein [Stutzerimonas stutzeri]UEG60147.1 DUF2846 domain-containing protein [Stutzerimonas chloritidismutans]